MRSRGVWTLESGIQWAIGGLSKTPVSVPSLCGLAHVVEKPSSHSLWFLLIPGWRLALHKCRNNIYVLGNCGMCVCVCPCVCLCVHQGVVLKPSPRVRARVSKSGIIAISQGHKSQHSFCASHQLVAMASRYVRLWRSRRAVAPTPTRRPERGRWLPSNTRGPTPTPSQVRHELVSKVSKSESTRLMYLRKRRNVLNVT